MLAEKDNRGIIIKYIMLTLLIVMSLTLFSCDRGVDSTRGFSLPKGNIETGKIVFLKYQCLVCHSLKGIEDNNIEKHQNISIALGGDKTQVVTYADLLTSIINPSHKSSYPYSTMKTTVEGISKMKIFNDVMTVTELIDLVTFLQPNYSLAPYKPRKYIYYP
jgi:hypothetical protein